jgi:hypothetical protein
MLSFSNYFPYFGEKNKSRFMRLPPAVCVSLINVWMVELINIYDAWQVYRGTYPYLKSMNPSQQ